MSKIETVTVDSMEGFLLEIVPRLGFHRAPVYRGHAREEWPLMPPLLREDLSETEFDSWAGLEAALVQRLKQRSGGELGYRPATELEWMAAAEACGVPSRLSAWTENALVALHFATGPEEEGRDGVVWRLAPGEDGQTISHDFEQVPAEARIYLPRHRSRESLNQRTAFLVHPLPRGNAAPAGFEDLFERGRQRLSLARIEIPAYAKPLLRSQLAAMGIDSEFLLPGMSGIGRRIREEIRARTDSYEWIFPE